MKKMKTRNKRKGEICQALVLLWITESGKMSLYDMLMKLQQRNKRFTNTKALSMNIKPLVTKKILMRVSEYPNPEYDLYKGN